MIQCDSWITSLGNRFRDSTRIYAESVPALPPWAVRWEFATVISARRRRTLLVVARGSGHDLIDPPELPLDDPPVLDSVVPGVGLGAVVAEGSDQRDRDGVAVYSGDGELVVDGVCETGDELLVRLPEPIPAD